MPSGGGLARVRVELQKPVPKDPATDIPLVPTGMIAVLATDVPGTRFTVDVPPMTSGRSVGKAWIQPD